MSRRLVKLKPALPRLRLRETGKDVSASNGHTGSELSQRDRSKSPVSSAFAESRPRTPLGGPNAKETCLTKEDTSLDSVPGGRGLPGSASAARSCRKDASLEVGARGLPTSPCAKASNTPHSAHQLPGMVQGVAAKRNDLKASSACADSPTSFADNSPSVSPSTAATTASTPRTTSAGHSMPKVLTADAAAARRAPTVVRAAAPAGSPRNGAPGLKATSHQSTTSTRAMQTRSPRPPSSQDDYSDRYHVQSELLELLDSEFSGTDTKVNDMVTGQTRELYQCFLRGYARTSCRRKRPRSVRNDLWELFEEVCNGDPLTPCEDDERDPSDGADHYAYFARYAPPSEPTECPQDNERRLRAMQMKFLGTRMVLRSVRQEQVLRYQQSLKSKTRPRKVDANLDCAQSILSEPTSPGTPAQHRHSMSFDMSEVSVQSSEAVGAPKRSSSWRRSVSGTSKTESDEDASPDNRRSSSFFWSSQVSFESDDSPKREPIGSELATVSCDEGSSFFSAGGSPDSTDELEMWAEPVRQSRSMSRTSAKQGRAVRSQIGPAGDEITSDSSSVRLPEGRRKSDTRTPASTRPVVDIPKRTATTPQSFRPALQRRRRRRNEKLEERRENRKSQAISATSAAVTQAVKAEMRTREACESLRFLVFGWHAEEKRAKNGGGAFYDQACGTREEVLQLHRIWTQMDEDGSGDIEFNEFLNYFSNSKADRLLGMRCVKYLVGSGLCDDGDNPQGCRIEDMMRLIWLKATKDDIAKMMHWFYEAEHDKDRAPTPPLLPKRKRREILENFPVLELGGTITFQDLVESGLVDESTAKDLREEHGQESTNLINKDLLLLMLCPNGFRVKSTDTAAVDKEGRRIRYLVNEYFTGWIVVGTRELECSH